MIRAARGGGATASPARSIGRRARRWRLLPCLLLLLLPAAAAAVVPDAPGGPPASGADPGWQSASIPELDFRANGSAGPMYALFVVALIVFGIGVRRVVGRWGGTVRPAGPGALRRVLTHGVLQARLARRPLTAAVHLPIFWGVAVLAAGSLLILVDTYVLRPSGLSPPRGAGYRVFQGLLDAAGVLLIAGVTLALYRRLRQPRGSAGEGPRMLPALLALLGLGISGFLLEGLRISIESGPAEPWSFVGSAIAGWLGGSGSRSSESLAAYRLLWWGHAGLALGWLAAIPYSRLRHLFTAPLQIALAPDRPSAVLEAPFHLKELAASGRFDVQVGISRVEQIAARDRIALSSCTGSAACRDACPAVDSGTALSPERLIRSLRDACESTSPGNGGGPAIFEDLLQPEEVWSCTLCGACARACPVLVDPLRPIVEMRRGLVAANAAGAARTRVLENLSRTGNPYGLPAAERGRLSPDLGLPALADGASFDLVYWIGCAATFDPRARRIAAAMAGIFRRAGIRAAILGQEEGCTGDPARRIGEEGLFQELAFRNLETFERHGVRKIVTHCAHCFNTLGGEYAALGGQLEVTHHASFLRDLIDSGRVRPEIARGSTATLHDACYLARFHGEVESPRSVLRSIPGLRLQEMERHGGETFCCGAGGGQYWYEVPRRERIGAIRLREARGSGAGLVVSECPFCLKMFEDQEPSSDGHRSMEILDIAEVVAASLRAGPSAPESP